MMRLLMIVLSQCNFCKFNNTLSPFYSNSIKIRLYSNGNTILIKIQPLLLTFKCIKNNYPKFNTIKYCSLYLFEKNKG